MAGNYGGIKSICKDLGMFMHCLFYIANQSFFKFSSFEISYSSPPHLSLNFVNNSWRMLSPTTSAINVLPTTVLSLGLNE